jgi:hypothetical protein
MLLAGLALHRMFIFFFFLFWFLLLQQTLQDS